MDSDSGNDWSDSGDSAVLVTEIAIGMPGGGAVLRASCLQNPQKGVKCVSCNQYFKTREFMSQHWQAKHSRDDRLCITRSNAEELKRLESRVEESKRQKLFEDQELLHRQQLTKHKLYDDEEQKTKEALAARDISNAEKQDKEKIREQQLRSHYDDAAEELQLRQARQITTSSLEFEIQQALRDIMGLLQSVPLEEENFDSSEFAQLENLREVVEREQKAVRDRLSKIDAQNRRFFEKAASQINSDAGARKLLKMVCSLQPDIACTGAGLQKIQDEISRSLSSLKQMEELASAAHQPEAINELSNLALEQLTAFAGDQGNDYEELSRANTQLSSISEKLRMATSHVFSSIGDCLEHFDIPNDAREAFIWMQFEECFVDIDDIQDAKLAFPLAIEAACAPVCSHCSEHRRPSESDGDELRPCAHFSARTNQFTWACSSHFHLSCREKALRQLPRHQQRSVDGVRVDKKTMFYCLTCLQNVSKKKKLFRAAKFKRAADVTAPPNLTFCEIYGRMSLDDSEYTVHSVKPGVFPFLSFGWHHAERGSADWKSVEYWIEKAQRTNSAAVARGASSSIDDASSQCALVVRDCPDGKVWSFSGKIQTQRCARVGVLTADTLRKCGLADARLAEMYAAELMKKMRHFHMNFPLNPEKKWEVICVKKVECWAMALARDNGDVVVADGIVSLSGPLPDTSNPPAIRTRSLTVKKSHSERCAAELVAWNCNGTVLAASCHDCRVVTWEKGCDIDPHPVDNDPKFRHAKSSTSEWTADGPIVSLSWSPIHPNAFLAATASSCYILQFQAATTASFASILVESVHTASSDITCAVFGSNGAYIAIGTQSSGWFAVNSSPHLQSFRSEYILPLDIGTISSVLCICSLPVVKSGPNGSDSIVDGRDFAVASRVVSYSIVHIWKYSEFKCKFEVVKELRLPSNNQPSSLVTSLLCSRDSDKDADSFKILALNGSSTGYLINYLGGYCYDAYIRPVEFWCPMEKRPVNVSRAAWGLMARAIAFCDFSAEKSKELGGFWWGLPRLYELWRGQTDSRKSISKPWQADHREAFGRALTTDISVHTVVRDGRGHDDGNGDLRIFERVWNHDVVLHQQVVNDLADYWKDLGKARSISGEVVEKVVQQIACLQLRLSFPPDPEGLPDAGKSCDKRRTSEQLGKRGLSLDGSCLVPVNDQGDPYSDLSAELFRSLLKCYLAV